MKRPNPKTYLFTLPVALFLLGCAATEERRGLFPILANQDDRSGSAAASGLSRFGFGPNGRTGDRRETGTDDFLGEIDQPDRPLVLSDNGQFTINLVNVEIEQAAQAVFGEALNLNYAVAPGVSGTVTLQTSRPLSEQELYDTFRAILELSGATIDATDQLITIVSATGALRSVGVFDGNVQPDARVVAVPLRYIGTSEMARLLSPIVGSSVDIDQIQNRNVLLISGSRGEIGAALDAVNLFDVDVLAGRSVALVQLSAAEPEALVTELEAIFEAGEGGSLQDVVTFIPSQRLGAVIIVSTRAEYLSEAERWVRDLDQAAGGVERRPVVYALQNRDAVDLTPVLTEMLGNASSQDADGPLPGTARVVADDTNNSIIVWGNNSEQEAFARLISSLDTTPVQVLLEATIAEVSLNDELNFGLRWFFENGELRTTFSNASSGSVASSFPGLSFAFQGTSAAVVLSALSSVTDVNVVSSPSLMVIDNQEARLQIGDEVPVATQQVRDVSDPDAPIVNTISFRDTGIILTVRPRVSESGRVLLDIEQEVSSVSTTTTSGIDSPTIAQRRIETSVSLVDGQTIALGGLIEESRNQTNTQVPGAGNIPVVGALFRNRSDTANRTELLVLITPQVIRNGAEASEVTAELRDRLGEADGFVSSGTLTQNDAHRIFD